MQEREGADRHEDVQGHVRGQHGVRCDEGVRRQARRERGDCLKNAAKACKAERAADPAAFTTKYGTNKNGKNAYGKCVSAMARGVTEQQTEARVNAAKTCKKLRAEHKADFETAYGTKKNAFGKCVSKTAKVS